MTTDTSEEKQSLWRLVAAPALWVAHLFACYFTAAIWCEKSTAEDTFWSVRVAIGVYTSVALILIGIIGWSGWKRHGHGHRSLSHGEDSAASRHRFLGFATSLLAALSAVAVLYQALPAVFIGSCQ